MAALPVDGLGRIIAVFLILAHRDEQDGVADGGQRVPQLMGEGGQEIVLLLVVFLELLDEHLAIVLGPLAVIDVERYARHGNRPSGGVAQAAPLDADPMDRPIRPTGAVLDIEVGIPVGGFGDRPPPCWPVDVEHSRGPIVVGERIAGIEAVVGFGLPVADGQKTTLRPAGPETQPSDEVSGL